MTETTNDPNLLKTSICLERKKHELIQDEYQLHERKIGKLVRSGLFRGQSHRPKELPNNHHQRAT